MSEWIIAHHSVFIELLYVFSAISCYLLLSHMSSNIRETSIFATSLTYVSVAVIAELVGVLHSDPSTVLLYAVRSVLMIILTIFVIVDSIEHHDHSEGGPPGHAFLWLLFSIMLPIIPVLWDLTLTFVQ